MGRLDVYEPRNKNGHKFTGGSFGEIYRNVIRKARNFIKSPQGSKIKGIKRKKILQIGANAVDNILSGQPSFQSLKSAKKKIKKNLSSNDLTRFKNSILKKGGLTLYRLNKKNRRQLKYRKKRGKGKKKRRGKKKSSSLETFYRLSNLASRFRKGRKSNLESKFRKRRKRKKSKKRKERNVRRKGKKRKKGVKKNRKKGVKKGGGRTRTVFDL